MLKVALFTFACTAACAAPACGYATCLADDEIEATQAESDLQAIYETVWERSGYEEKLLLQKAQGAWLDYRDANCDLVSARPDGFSLDARLQCVEFMSRERTTELKLVERTLVGDAPAP